MRRLSRTRVVTVLVAVSLVGGCASLLPKPAPPPALFTLVTDAPNHAGSTSISKVDQSSPTLIVNPTRAAAGFESSHIVYVRRAQEIEYFAINEWVDTPAHMLMPLITRSIEGTGAFRAVLAAPTVVSGRYRLDTEIIRLQQDFSREPSEVRFTLNAVLIDTTTHGVVASRAFDASVAATTDDPYGGVVAAQKAIAVVLARLAAFCSESIKP